MMCMLITRFDPNIWDCIFLWIILLGWVHNSEPDVRTQTVWVGGCTLIKQIPFQHNLCYFMPSKYGVAFQSILDKPMTEIIFGYYNQFGTYMKQLSNRNYRKFLLDICLCMDNCIWAMDINWLDKHDLSKMMTLKNME